MDNQEKSTKVEQKPPTPVVEGVLVRIGASTAGCAAVGGAIGSFFGPGGSGVGATVGGVIGLAASVTDTIRSSNEASPHPQGQERATND